MTEIPLRELRNHTSEVLRRVAGGECLTVTVSGRQVAQLVPMPRRRQTLTWDEIVTARADPGLRDDLRELLPDDTDHLMTRWDDHAGHGHRAS